MFRCVVVSLIYVVVVFDGFGQSSSKDFLTRKQALEDLGILRQSLYEVHPNTFRYSSRASFESRFSAVKNLLRDSVQPSIDDVLSGRDAKLELIYTLIE